MMYENLARIRMMQEAYDLADEGHFESYNAIKVMASDVLDLIKEAVKVEREECAKICLEEAPSLDGQLCAEAIRARGEKS